MQNGVFPEMVMLDIVGKGKIPHAIHKTKTFTYNPEGEKRTGVQKVNILHFTDAQRKDKKFVGKLLLNHIMKSKNWVHLCDKEQNVFTYEEILADIIAGRPQMIGEIYLVYMHPIDNNIYDYNIILSLLLQSEKISDLCSMMVPPLLVKTAYPETDKIDMGIILQNGDLLSLQLKCFTEVGGKVQCYCNTSLNGTMIHIPYHERHPIDLFIFVPVSIAKDSSVNQMLILTKQQLVNENVLANDKGCKGSTSLPHSWNYYVKNSITVDFSEYMRLNYANYA